MTVRACFESPAHAGRVRFGGSPSGGVTRKPLEGGTPNLVSKDPRECPRIAGDDVRGLKFRWFPETDQRVPTNGRDAFHRVRTFPEKLGTRWNASLPALGIQAALYGAWILLMPPPAMEGVFGHAVRKFSKPTSLGGGLLQWLCSAAGGLSLFCSAAVGGEDLLLESQPITATGAGAELATEAWRPGGGRARSVLKERNPSFTGLRFRFAYETKRDESYLLTQQFTLWSNGVTHGSISVSNLLSGDGSTRWETNQIIPHGENGGIVFKLGPEVLTGGVAYDTAVGITRVTLEPYSGGCGTCGTGAGPGPGRPGPLFDSLCIRFGLGQTSHGQAVGELLLSPAVAGSRAVPASRPAAAGISRWRDRSPGWGSFTPGGREPMFGRCAEIQRYKYQLLFYATNALIPGHAPNVLIPTNGLSPFVRWTIENPDGAAGTNRLRLIEETGSLRVTNTYAWIGTGWEIQAGNGLRKQLLTSAWDQEHRIRTETRQTLEPAGGRVVAQTVSRHQLFDWGEGLVEEVAGSGKQARTNFSTYYNSPGKPWHGRLETRARGDGFWERYEYDERGRIRTRYSPYGNTSARDYRTGRAVTYDYGPWSTFGDSPDILPLRARTITERIRQVVTARAYLIAAPSRTIEIRCASKSSVPFDSPALCTTNRYYPDADANSTRLQSGEHPDGTMEIHSYGINPDNLTNVVFSGQPNSSHTEIVNGTKTLTVLGNIGQILLKEIYDIAPGRTNRPDLPRSVCLYRWPAAVSYGELPGRHEQRGAIRLLWIGIDPRARWPAHLLRL